MAINYNKYINSTGTHYIANSGSDERGKYHGGSAGDQTGKEWQLRSWYNRPWSCVLRHPDPQVRRLVAELGIEGALNDKIGYDQYQRTTFWKQLSASGYRPANITVACEEDCTAGVAAIVKAAGYLLNNEKLKGVSIDAYSGNLKSVLKKAGFEVLTDSKYRSSGNYLLPGDVLLYEGHHAATNITRGSKASGDVASSVNTGSGNTGSTNTGSTGGLSRILKNGMSGSDVLEMQKNLIKLGYGSLLGSDGADGDFGDNTEQAVKKFQKDHSLEVDGEYGENSYAAMQKALKELEKPATTPSQPATGSVIGTAKALATMNIRSGAGTAYESIGTVSKGTVLNVYEVLSGGWYKVAWKNGYGYTSNSTGDYYTYTPNAVTTPKGVDAPEKTDSAISGTYTTTGKLNMRSGAGTSKPVVTVVPNGKNVVCAGSYSVVSGTKWLLVTYDKYTGYCSEKYLKK